MLIRTAILVDGGFYRKRAATLFGKKTPEQRADELMEYCKRHYNDKSQTEEQYLYRIFYYDCKPYDKVVYHPLLQKNIDFKKTEMYKWSNDFFECLTSKRKVALRMGELLDASAGYVLKEKTLKALCNKIRTIEDLTEDDFTLSITQKGVDMRIGLDIASLANKRLVDRIILIAGDSDFVPAAKHARREGIDFILDPLKNKIKPNLQEHIDGLRTKCKNDPTKDSLHISHISAGS